VLVPIVVRSDEDHIRVSRSRRLDDLLMRLPDSDFEFGARGDRRNRVPHVSLGAPARGGFDRISRGQQLRGECRTIGESNDVHERDVCVRREVLRSPARGGDRRLAEVQPDDH